LKTLRRVSNWALVVLPWVAAGGLAVLWLSERATLRELQEHATNLVDSVAAQQNAGVTTAEAEAEHLLKALEQLRAGDSEGAISDLELLLQAVSAPLRKKSDPQLRDTQSKLDQYWAEHRPANEVPRRDRFSAVFSGRGWTAIRVVELKPGGSLERAGVAPDDLLLQVNETRIDSLESATAVEALLESGAATEVLVLDRLGNERSVNLR
jgi:hypothetical protein